MTAPQLIPEYLTIRTRLYPLQDKTGHHIVFDTEQRRKSRHLIHRKLSRILHLFPEGIK